MGLAGRNFNRTRRHDMARKKKKPLTLSTGDWVAFPVVGFDKDHATIRELDRVRLPASPAVLARSHRLLMRWYHRAVKDVNYTPVPWDRAVLMHCRRIAKGKKGPSHG